MLIRLFRYSYTFQYGLLILLGILLWLPELTSRTPGISPEGITGRIGDLLPGTRSLLPRILALCMMLIQAFLVNLVLIRHQLLPRNSLHGAFIFILLMSHHPSLTMMYPMLLANFLLIAAMDQILVIYSLEEPYQKVFSAGMLISLASWVDIHTVALILAVLFTFIVYRLNHWREWVILTLGWMLPLVYYGVWAFLTDRQLLPEAIMKQTIRWAGWTEDVSGLTLSLYIWMGLLTLIALMKVLPGIGEQIISIRKRTWALVWYGVVSAATVVFVAGLPSGTVAMAMLPLSALTAKHIAELRKTFWWDLFLVAGACLMLANGFWGRSVS